MQSEGGSRRFTGLAERLVPCSLVVLVTLVSLVLWLIDPIAVQGLRLAQFDQFQRWSPRVEGDSAVRVVDIDEASLKAYGQWPWPRTRMAELVDRLRQAGATTIAFDVLLAEPDRTSPAAMAQLWSLAPNNALLHGLPDHDVVLGRSLAHQPVVLGSSLSHSSLPASAASTQPTERMGRVARVGDADPGAWLHRFEDAVWPLPVLAASASGVGALNFAPDSDGVVRRVPLVMGLGGQVVPTLVAELMRVRQGASTYVLRSTPAGMQELRIGGVSVPTTAQGEIWLHYPRSPSHNSMSVQQVLQGQLPAQALDGKIVLIGSSAAGLLDLRSNPMGQLMPGVQAHALALEQMLSGQYLQRPGWAPAVEALVLVLGALGAGLLALRVSARRATAGVVVLLVLVLVGAWYGFVAQHLLLDAINPALAIVLSFIVGSGVHHYTSERQQRWLRQAFSRYVSPNRVAHLVAHPEQLHLGGQRQMCSFVFTDLAGFTAMMELGEPARAVALLNDYLDGMLAIVFRHEGTLDRIVGDAIAVLFSAPVTQSDHCQRALDCALEMDRFAISYAARLQAQGVAWGTTRIGVHSGEVIVGNFGGKTLFDYRALGDAVNTASRLEGANKALGTRVCVSQATLVGCVGVPVRPIGRVLLKGKSLPVQVFEPLSTLEPASCAAPNEYASAMHMLQSGEAVDLQAARAAFETLVMRFPGDSLVALHLQRLRQGATDDLIVLEGK